MEIGKASCHQKLFSEREFSNYRVCGKEKKRKGVGKTFPKLTYAQGTWMSYLSMDTGHREGGSGVTNKFRT